MLLAANAISVICFSMEGIPSPEQWKHKTHTIGL